VKPRWIVIGLLVGVGALVGWRLLIPAPLPANLSTVLRESTEFELFSIDFIPLMGKEIKEKPNFHNYPILGSTKIMDPKIKNYLTTTLERAAQRGRQGAACFDPRHAIRAKHKGDIYGVILCFQCERAVVTRGTESVADFPIGSGYQPPFDKVLTEAGITLAPH